MIQPKKILVAGDFLLDIYTFGDVERISPEAPVPILRVCEEKRRPGGAGNAILNLAALGMEVVAFGRVGNDVGGSGFLQEMAKAKIDTRFVFCDRSFQTPLKNRMIAAGQQIVRVDFETPHPLGASFEQEAISLLPRLLEGIDLVAISDYAKGFLTSRLLSSLIAAANERAIPTIVDPKGCDFSRYKGATLIKPNAQEALQAAKLPPHASLENVAARLIQETEAQMLMITRSKEGISLFTSAGERQDFPAQVHEVKDVTGAGDTVLAVISAAYANNLSMEQSCILANSAAAIAIEQIGCIPVPLSSILNRLGAKKEIYL